VGFFVVIFAKVIATDVFFAFFNQNVDLFINNGEFRGIVFDFFRKFAIMK